MEEEIVCNRWKDLADEEREGMEQGSELETRDKKR